MRLFLPRVCDAAVLSAAAETEIAYAPSPDEDGGRSGRERLQTGSATELMIPPGRLDRSVDHETDHALGAADAEIMLVEYGSYACPRCRAANERIAQAHDQLGDRPLRLPAQAAQDNSLAFCRAR